MAANVASVAILMKLPWAWLNTQHGHQDGHVLCKAGAAHMCLQAAQGLTLL